jgi:hypothetical protein
MPFFINILCTTRRSSFLISLSLRDFYALNPVCVEERVSDEKKKKRRDESGGKIKINNGKSLKWN